MKNGIKAEYVH